LIAETVVRRNGKDVYLVCAMPWGYDFSSIVPVVVLLNSQIYYFDDFVLILTGCPEKDDTFGEIVTV